MTEKTLNTDAYDPDAERVAETSHIYGHPRFAWLPLAHYFTGRVDPPNIESLLIGLGFDLQPGGCSISSMSSGLRACFIPEGWSYSGAINDGLRTNTGLIIAQNAFGFCSEPKKDDPAWNQMEHLTKPPEAPKALIWNSLETTLALMSREAAVETPAG